MPDYSHSGGRERTSDSDMLLRGAALSALGRAGATIVRLATSVLITRTLGAELFGVFAIANRFADAGSTAARVGQHDAVVHFLPKYRRLGDLARARGAFLISLALAGVTSGLAAIVVFVTAAPIASRVFGNATLTPVARVLALGIPFAVLGAVLVAVLRSLKAIRALEWVRSVMVPLSRLASCALLFALGYGIQGLAWAMNFSLFLGAVAGLYFIWKKSRLFDRSTEPIYEVRKVVAFSTPVLFLGLATFGYSNADVFFLGRFDETRNVGIYALGLRILTILQLPITAFQSMFVPLASELYGAGDIGRLDRALKSTARWVLTSTLPLYLAAVLFARPLLSVWGPEFVDGATVLTVLGSIAVTNAFAVLTGYAVYMSGRSWLILGNAVLMLAFSGLLYTVLVPSFGALGASVGRAIAFAGFACLTLAEAYCLLKIHPFHAGLFKPLLSGGLSFALCYGLRASGLLAPGILASMLLLGVFVILYVGGVSYLGLAEEDRRILERLRARLGRR